MANSKDVYERKFLELLLRHELPDDCEVRIDVSNVESAKAASGSAVFTLKGGAISVNSSIDKIGLKRILRSEVPCW
jgi:hypothetical protein